MNFKIRFSLVWEPTKGNEENFAWEDSASLALECAQALQDVPKVKEFLKSGEKEVWKDLRNSGWGWIPPFGKEWEDPDWTSPGLYRRNDAGYVEVSL